ncbi:hypothetical protein BD626DRAFT_635137 [Schizophyllum amplum]|uniref:F-box domain-containing protein n=1 Tax=Schizophyllum amplum TaxID=97359 RepID=A0A550BWY9_9AGAR|nr:hypothetical protein BD626DRAFT_635137 [Auriculariopsis ampla]
MHPALAIAELRSAICKELILPRLHDDTGYIDWDYWEIRRGKTDLCSLARVSRAWTPVAEAIIWESLPSLTPLLRLLPDDAIMRLRRSLRAEDWAQVSRHASLVKDIWVLALQYPVKDQERIAGWLPQGVSLLPRLRRLDIIQYEVSWVSPNFVGTLLSPSVTALKLWGFRTWPIPQWPAIISRFPQIASIELENPCHDFFCNDVWPGHSIRYSDVGSLNIRFLFPGALTTCDRLTAVRLLVDLDQCTGFILMMAVCPKLETLDFALQVSGEIYSWAVVDIPYPSFRSLRSLSCLDAPISLAQSIIASTSGKSQIVHRPDFTTGEVVCGWGWFILVRQWLMLVNSG